MEKILSIDNVRWNLTNLVKGLQEGAEPIVVIKRGKPVAVILDFSEYESWLATLEEMKDKGSLKALKEAIEDEKKGRLFTHEEVFGHPTEDILHEKSERGYRTVKQEGKRKSRKKNN